MRARRLVLVAAFFAAISVYGAQMWRNLDNEHRICGRKLSDGYLRGKAVLVNRWGAKDAGCCALLPRLEALWDSFKAQQFVVLGSHCKGWGDTNDVIKAVIKAGVRYAIYEDAGLAVREPWFRVVPYIYVVDPTGRIVYKGEDDRRATDVIVGVMARWESPDKVKDWQRALDWELMNLPGHAVLRYQDFQKAHPEEAKAYEGRINLLEKMEGMTDLVKLVKISRNLADFMPKTDKQRAELPERIKKTIARFEFLKTSKDPQISQEAKNAIADLMWYAAEL